MSKKIKSEDLPRGLLPLTNDLVFKRVFAKEGNEEILKSLLEAILEVKIKKVIVKNPQLPVDLIDNKAGVLDIKVEIDEHTICDVEMQVNNESNMDSRSTYYMAKILADDLKRSQEYTEVKKAIVISILSFNFYKRNSYHSIAHMKFEKSKPETYINLGYAKEEETATEDLEMHFIELPKFIKKNPEVKSKLEQWLWAIAGEGEKREMAEKENKKVEEALNVLKEMSMSPEEWELYDSRERAIVNYNSGMLQAKLDGIAERRKER